MDITAWRTQLRKGAAELLVLALLERGEAYGAQILDGVNADGPLVAAGALYPLLGRLERNGRIVASWSAPAPDSAPRKYYSLTAEGRAALADMRGAWSRFRDGVDSALTPSDPLEATA